MGKSRTWVLLANWTDISQLRNRIVLDMSREIGLKNARVTLSGRNLFYFAPFWKMSDPENRSGYGIGIPRAVTLGVNVTL